MTFIILCWLDKNREQLNDDTVVKTQQNTSIWAWTVSVFSYLPDISPGYTVYDGICVKK